MQLHLLHRHSNTTAERVADVSFTTCLTTSIHSQHLAQLVSWITDKVVGVIIITTGHMEEGAEHIIQQNTVFSSCSPNFAADVFGARNF